MKIEESNDTVTFTVVLPAHEAYAYAQFLKRVCFSDYRIRAYDDDDCYRMVYAGEAIRDGLAKAGFYPR